MKQIQKLRKLLDLYYDGRSTAEQNREISELFRKIPVLPEDLIADRDVFLSMSALYEQPHNTSELLDNVFDSTLETITATDSRRRHRHLLWAVSISAAAAIALIISIAYRYHIHSDSSTDSQPIFSETPARQTSPSPIQAPTATPDRNSRPQLIAEAAASFHPRKRKRRTRSASRQVAERAVATNVRIVTDPEEAARYAEQAFRLLSDNLNLSTSVQKQTSTTISDIKSEISNALNTYQ